MMLGGVLTMLLSPFVAAEDMPAACRFSPMEEPDREPAVFSLMLQPTQSTWRGTDAVMRVGGARLHAVVRPNTATEVPDVLITAADREGHRIVLALRQGGQAILLRERAAGPVEKLAGHCDGGGRMVDGWFAG